MAREEIMVEGPVMYGVSRLKFVSETAVKLTEKLMPIGRAPDEEDVGAVTVAAITAATSLWHHLCLEFPLSPEEPQETEEEPNENGDTILYITPGTAPCSEIGRELNGRYPHTDGLSARMVARLAKDNNIKSAGVVVWSLAKGETSEAKTYDLHGWQEIAGAAMRRGLIPSNSNLTPPLRLQGKDL